MATQPLPWRQRFAVDSALVRELPIDPVTENYVRHVAGAAASLCSPTPIEAPHLVACSATALSLIDVDVSDVAEDSAGAAEMLCGNVLPRGAVPSASCYAGHQFGVFSGQLGDGAAILLGDVVNRRGERWELQLKGAGPTPYSRTADGRKVLRSSMREFLASEWMSALGTPTTRSASIVTSDTRVVRDVFYTGDHIQERATVITRLAPTFLRFGSFEVCKPRDPLTGRAGPSVGQVEVLEALLLYTWRRFFSGAQAPPQRPLDDALHVGAPAAVDVSMRSDAPAAVDARRYVDMFEAIVAATARTAAAWQALGWVHGVLNTDNMHILGLTIDYGPYGQMERTSAGFVPNTSDTEGRYCFAHQPAACRWNCVKLGEAFACAPSVRALSPAWDFRAAATRVFDATYRDAYLRAMRAKLGLAGPSESCRVTPGVATSAADLASSTSTSSVELPRRGDASAVPPPATFVARGSTAAGCTCDGCTQQLVARLLAVMEQTGADYTLTFLALEGEMAPHTASSSPSAVDSALSALGGPRDSTLDALLAVCASPADMVDEAPPGALPLAQLREFAALAKRDPRVALRLGDGFAQALERAERADRLAAMSVADKRAADAEVWSAWLVEYRAALAVDDADGAQLDAARNTDAEAEAHCGCSSSAASSRVNNASTQAVTGMTPTTEQGGLPIAANATSRRRRRALLQRSSNPRVVLRNWIAQRAIDAAEAGDDATVAAILAALQDPFCRGSDAVSTERAGDANAGIGTDSERATVEESPGVLTARGRRSGAHASAVDYTRPAPPELRCLRVSCSS